MVKQAVALLCALCFVAVLSAQERNNAGDGNRLGAADVNAVLAEARSALDRRQYDEAATKYRQALRLAAPLPEAEYGLALVLHADGLAAAAERQYVGALSHRAHLRVPEMVHEIRYSLATLYREQNQLFEYERQLELIAAEHRPYGRDSLRLNAKRLLYERGIDRLFELYRFDNYFALSAHAQLGEHYVRSGNYSQAVDHLIFAFILRGGQLADISRRHALNAQRQSYSQLFANAHRIAPIRNQLNSGYDIYRLIFYFGAALYGDNPQNRRWREVLSLISDIDNPSPWITRARARLASPALEPLYP